MPAGKRAVVQRKDGTKDSFSGAVDDTEYNTERMLACSRAKWTLMMMKQS